MHCSVLCAVASCTVIGQQDYHSDPMGMGADTAGTVFTVIHWGQE